MAGKYTFMRRNGLSLVLLGLMILCWAGQFLTGWAEKNKEREEEGKPALSVIQYSRSGHFIQATFENWESEFFANGPLRVVNSKFEADGFFRIKKDGRGGGGRPGTGVPP